jgi:hypothetical protein
VFEPTLHQAVLKEAKGPGGRPRFNPMLMFKVLVLQKRKRPAKHLYLSGS